MKREVADEINAIKNELSLISTRVAKLEESQAEVAIELPTNSLKTDPKESIEATLATLATLNKSFSLLKKRTKLSKFWHKSDISGMNFIKIM